MIASRLADRPRASRFLRHAMRFGIVGVSATVLYFVLGWSLHRAGAAIEIASPIAQVLSILYSYAMQKTFTFGVDGQHARFGPRFVVATAGIAGLAQILVWSIDESGFGATTALLANCVFFPAASFFIHTFWTFAEPAPIVAATPAEDRGRRGRG